MKVTTTHDELGEVDHEFDTAGNKAFGMHTLFREDMQGWWWVVSTGTPEPKIVATGPAASEADAKRRASHFLGATKALLGDA